MRCKTVLMQIDALRTSELDPATAHEVAVHLGGCPSCNASAGDLERFSTIARALVAEAPRSIRKNVTAAVCDSLDVIVVDGERIWVAFSARGIRMIDIRATTPEEMRRAYCRRFGRDLRAGALPDRYRAVVESAVRGEGGDLSNVDLTRLPDFEREVLQAIVTIPRGEVRPYSLVARLVHRPKAVRAVATVMGRNPIPFVLPCHRVVPLQGGIGNYGFGPARKRALLRAEGAPVDELLALGRRGVRYIGSKTTKIFCFPTCRDARRIRQANRVEFHGATDATQNGYRPCRRCTPVALGA